MIGGPTGSCFSNDQTQLQLYDEGSSANVMCVFLNTYYMAMLQPSNGGLQVSGCLTPTGAAGQWGTYVSFNESYDGNTYAISMLMNATCFQGASK